MVQFEAALPNTFSPKDSKHNRLSSLFIYALIISLPLSDTSSLNPDQAAEPIKTEKKAK